MPWAPLIVGTVQSIVRRPYLRHADFKLVIVDEAVHHARANSLLGASAGVVAACKAHWLDSYARTS